VRRRLGRGGGWSLQLLLCDCAAVLMQSVYYFAASNPPTNRMRIIDNELILEDVCKDCPDDPSYPQYLSDLQVIQCNASNVHGYQFIDAYVNVLRKFYSPLIANCFYCISVSNCMQVRLGMLNDVRISVLKF